MSNLSYLIPVLRVKMWDIATPYRYTDEWLDVALVAAVKSLQRWWDNRYLVDSTNSIISRNSDSVFDLDEPPVIETSDERALILMAAIVIKEGNLENSAWNIGTWKDAEYYVSNTEGGKVRGESLQRDWTELYDILKPPQKRLNAGAREDFSFGSDETK